MIYVGGKAFKNSKTEKIKRKKNNFSNSTMRLLGYVVNSKRGTAKKEMLVL